MLVTLVVCSHGRDRMVASPMPGLPGLLSSGRVLWESVRLVGCVCGAAHSPGQALQPEERPGPQVWVSPLLLPSVSVLPCSVGESRCHCVGWPPQPRVKPERAGSFGFLLCLCAAAAPCPSTSPPAALPSDSPFSECPSDAPW